MRFQYETEMRNYGLSYKDLPEDAQTGIDNIKDIQKALSLLERTGKQPSPKTFKKIQAMDKWVCYEIVDFVNDTNRNEDEMPFDEDEIIEQIESETQSVEAKSNNIGVAIEAELQNLFQQGKKKLDIEDLRDDAPNCYSLLFDTYDPEEENGIITTKFSLLEGSDEMFHLKRN